MGESLSYLYRNNDESKRRLLAIINGLIGDTLAELNSPLAIQMSFREHGRDVHVADLSLPRHAPENKRHFVIFVHGLMGEDGLWQESSLWQSPSIETTRYGTLLEKELEVTGLYLRYNSGLHISDNGKNLNTLLQELVDLYGEIIGRITLIGYSMGGLVVRSAGYYAEKQRRNWLNKLSTVVLMSVPHEGSYVEQFNHLTSLILRTIPNIPTRIVAHVIDKRSGGIKDLRYGFMVEEDWKNQNSDHLGAVQRTFVNLVPSVNYHLIAGTIAEDEMSPLALFFGDGLVSKHSAVGDAFKNPVTQLTELITCKTFPKTNHATILTNEEVYQHLKQLLR